MCSFVRKRHEIWGEGISRAQNSNYGERGRAIVSWCVCVIRSIMLLTFCFLVFCFNLFIHSIMCGFYFWMCECSLFADQKCTFIVLLSFEHFSYWLYYNNFICQNAWAQLPPPRGNRNLHVAGWLLNLTCFLIFLSAHLGKLWCKKKRYSARTLPKNQRQKITFPRVTENFQKWSFAPFWHLLGWKKSIISFQLSQFSSSVAEIGEPGQIFLV